MPQNLIDSEITMRDLNGVADVNWCGLGENMIADVGTFEVIDAELYTGDSFPSRCYVCTHTRQRLRYQRRYSSVQHLERLFDFESDFSFNFCRIDAKSEI